MTNEIVCHLVWASLWCGIGGDEIHNFLLEGEPFPKHFLKKYFPLKRESLLDSQSKLSSAPIKMVLIKKTVFQRTSPSVTVLREHCSEKNNFLKHPLVLKVMRNIRKMAFILAYKILWQSDSYSLKR